MKRIVVMSDSHGAQDLLHHLVQAVWRQYPGQVDAYVHCGDGARDFADLTGALFQHDPHAQFHSVKGNCDFGADVSEDELLEMEGLRIFVCHGHRYRVKMGTGLLVYAAAERDCTVALYGHTHFASEDAVGGVTTFNPGAACTGSIGLMEVSDGGAMFRRMQLDEQGKLKEK